MVFTAIANFVRTKGPDEFWRKRKIFKLSAHFIGRRRNCYSVAIRNVHRALAYATKGRLLKKQDMHDLRDIRISAGCEQFGIKLPVFQETLRRNNIMLNRKVLADLAIWEPHTFEAIARISRERAISDNLTGVSEPQTDNRVYMTETKPKEN